MKLDNIVNEIQSSQYEIYCDMDNVLTDFNKRFEHFTGRSPSEYESELAKKYGEKKAKSMFWEEIDPIGVKFWEEMNWMDDGKELWNYIKKWNPKVLSSPSRSSTSSEGKKLWMHKHLPNVELILRYASRKPEFSGPDKILIDDRADTIAKWREKGGIGILHTSTKNTIKELEKLGLKNLSEIKAKPNITYRISEEGLNLVKEYSHTNYPIDPDYYFDNSYDELRSEFGKDLADIFSEFIFFVEDFLGNNTSFTYNKLLEFAKDRIEGYEVDTPNELALYFLKHFNENELLVKPNLSEIKAQPHLGIDFDKATFCRINQTWEEYFKVGRYIIDYHDSAQEFENPVLKLILFNPKKHKIIREIPRSELNSIQLTRLRYYEKLFKEGKYKFASSFNEIKAKPKRNDVEFYTEMFNGIYHLNVMVFADEMKKRGYIPHEIYDKIPDDFRSKVFQKEEVEEINIKFNNYLNQHYPKKHSTNEIKAKPAVQVPSFLKINYISWREPTEVTGFDWDGLKIWLDKTNRDYNNDENYIADKLYIMFHELSEEIDNLDQDIWNVGEPTQEHLQRLKLINYKIGQVILEKFPVNGIKEFYFDDFKEPQASGELPEKIELKDLIVNKNNKLNLNGINKVEVNGIEVGKINIVKDGDIENDPRNLTGENNKFLIKNSILLNGTEIYNNVRGKGIGSLLIQKIFEISNFENILFYVSNPKALEFWKKNKAEIISGKTPGIIFCKIQRSLNEIKARPNLNLDFSKTDNRIEYVYMGGSEEIDEVLRVDQVIYGLDLGPKYICLVPSYEQPIHIFPKKYFALDDHQFEFKYEKGEQEKYIKNEFSKGNYKIWK